MANLLAVINLTAMTAFMLTFLNGAIHNLGILSIYFLELVMWFEWRLRFTAELEAMATGTVIPTSPDSVAFS
jgi:hypothetical protein